MTTEKAILAGGCFWGLQDLIRKLPGVLSTRVGYTGGDVPNATYRNHHGHAEAMEIIFDPEKISYRDLLEFFFQIHDPSTLNRQGNRRRRRLRPVAGQGGHRGDAGRTVLGGRARAPGLPGALPRRVHVPLRAPRLEATAPLGQPHLLRS
jgi:hypothetical protein